MALVAGLRGEKGECAGHGMPSRTKTQEQREDHSEHGIISTLALAKQATVTGDAPWFGMTDRMIGYAVVSYVTRQAAAGFEPEHIAVRPATVTTRPAVKFRCEGAIE